MTDLPDVSNVDPNAGVYPILPKGQYPIQIYDSEKKVTANGNGEYLRLYAEILNGPHAGAKIRPIDLNLWNDNEQTVQIAQRMLAQICHATNTIGARDSQQFHHKAMLVELDIEPPRDVNGRRYGESNRAQRFLAIGSPPAAGPPVVTYSGPSHSGPIATSSQPGATAGNNTPPWRR